MSVPVVSAHAGRDVSDVEHLFAGAELLDTPSDLVGVVQALDEVDGTVAALLFGEVTDEVPGATEPVYVVRDLLHASPDQQLDGHGRWDGAFQIGIGAGLLLALVVSDGLVVALGTFAVASGLHTLTHFLDRHIGGHGSDVPLLGVFTVIAIAAIWAMSRLPGPGSSGHRHLSGKRRQS
ncbi:hypothetical protein [Nonomuraea sp. NPDC049695]|uniref:hypothetical protein n=1 Tax=Nonomuraea sp. NPDC049695 TaxID=3154734 RepID=UPI003435E30E